MQHTPGVNPSQAPKHADNLAADSILNEQPAVFAVLVWHSHDGKRLTHRLQVAGLWHDFASLYSQWPNIMYVDDTDYRSREHLAPDVRYLQAGITEAASRRIGGLAQSQGLRLGDLSELPFFPCNDCHHPQG